MLKYATALAALIALPGCGSGGTAEKQTSDTGAAAVASDVAPPTIAGATGIGISTADLPPFVELPTGTTAINNMRVGESGKAGGALTLKATQKPADLIAFYRASMAKHGLKIGLENVSDQSMQLFGENEDKSKSLMVTVLADDAGEVTLSLVHSRTDAQTVDGGDQ